MLHYFVRCLLFVSVTILLAKGAWAADYTRQPGSGAWNDPNLWSPVGVPGASDNARIESTAGNITLTASATVGLLDVAGTYTGTIALGANTLTTGQVSFAGGTFNGETGALVCNGSFAIAGGVFNAPPALTFKGNVTIPSGTFNHGNGAALFAANYQAAQTIAAGTAVFNHLTIKGNSISVTTIQDDLHVDGDLSFETTSYSGCRLNGGRILAKKNVTMASSGVGTWDHPGNAWLVLCGTADQTLNGATSGRFTNIRVDKPSGILHLVGLPLVFGSWDWVNAGGLNAGTSAITFATPYNTVVSIKGGPVSYGDVTFKGWGQFSKHDLVGDLQVGGALTLDVVAYSGNQVNGASFIVAGDVIMNNAGFGSASWGPGDSTIKLTGGGSHAIIANSSGHFPNMFIDTTGSVTTVGDVTVGGNWTFVNGTFTQGAGTLEFQAPYGATRTILPGTVSYGNVTITGNGLSNQSVAGTLHVAGKFILASAGYTGAKLNDGVVEVEGDFELPGDGFGASDGGPGSAIIRLAGSGTVTAGGLARCPALVVDTAGTITFAGSLRLGAHYVHSSGTVITAGSTQTFVGRQDSIIMGAARFGNLVVQKGPYGAPYKVTIDGQAAASGGFTLTEGTFDIADNAALAVGGDVSVAAANVSVTAGNNSTLGLNGAAAQSVNLAGKSVFNVSVSNATSPVTFTSAYTASGTTSAVPGAALVFASGVTFNTGKLTMNGTPAQSIALRAATEGSAANIVTAPYQFVRYADIKDVNASSGPKIVALHSTDGGNNQNVVFQSAALLALSTPAASKTSPAWVEGVSGPDATSVNATVDGTSFAASRLNPTQWYAQHAPAAASLGVVLNPDVTTALDITVANAFGESSTAHQDLTWVVTDFAGKSYSTDLVKIRKGDSLLLTGTGTGNTLEIDGEGDGTYEHSGVPGQKFPHPYTSPGSFVARAKIDGQEIGSITVVVISPNLEKPIACEVGYRREKDVVIAPAVNAADVVFSPNDVYLLEVSVKGPMTSTEGNGVTLYLKALARGTPQLVARLGASGPMFIAKEVDEFTLDVPGIRDAVVDADTGLGGTTFIIRPYIPDLRISFVMFAHQSTFTGGATSRSINTSDPSFEQIIDPATGELVGRTFIELEMPPAEMSYCFNMQVHQSASREVNISFPWAVNGHACRLRAPGPKYAIPETNDEDSKFDKDTAVALKPDWDPAKTDVQDVECWKSSKQTLVYAVKQGLGHPFIIILVPDPLKHSNNVYRFDPGCEFARQPCSTYPGNFFGFPPPDAPARKEFFIWNWTLGPQIEIDCNGHKEKVDTARTLPVACFPGCYQIPEYRTGIMHGVEPLFAQQLGGPYFPFKLNEIKLFKLEADGLKDHNPANANETDLTMLGRRPFPDWVGIFERPELFICPDKTLAKVGESVTFTADLVPCDPAVAPLKYAWNFGDGTPVETTAGPSHSYAAAGGYIVKLTIEDSSAPNPQKWEASFTHIAVRADDCDHLPTKPPTVAKPLGVPCRISGRGAPNDILDVCVEGTSGVARVSLDGTYNGCDKPLYFQLPLNADGIGTTVIWLQGANGAAPNAGAALTVKGQEHFWECGASTKDPDFTEKCAFKLTDTEPFRLIKVDLDLDANYDNIVNAADDAQELCRGGIVVRNTDSVYTDANQPAKRKQLVIQKVDPATYNGSVTVNMLTGNVKVFDAVTGGTEITFNGTDNVFSQTALPKTLWLQGGGNSSTKRAEERISVNHKEAFGSCDEVGASVIWVEIEQRGFNAPAIDGNTAGPGGAAEAGKTSNSPINTPFSRTITLGVQRDANIALRARANIELIGVISPATLEFGKLVPVDPRDDTPTPGLSTVDLGFSWERTRTDRDYNDGNPEPVAVGAPGIPAQVPFNTPDNSFFSNQDVTPSRDNIRQLVIADTDLPSTTIIAGVNRRTTYFNATQWTTITLFDGATNAQAQAAAERCSKRVKWANRVNITRNDQGTPANPADDTLNFVDAANDGAQENEVLPNQHTSLMLNGNPPTVTSITPDHEKQGQIAVVTINGSNFDPNAAPRLINGGNTITAGNVNRVSSTQITCRFNLTGAALGSWTVRVRNPDERDSTEAVSFTVDTP